MTRENREAAYKHHRNLEKNYEAPEHLNKGLTKTQTLRAHAKAIADALLARNPELAEFDAEPVKEKKETKSVRKK